MSDTSDALSTDSAVDKILSILGDDAADDAGGGPNAELPDVHDLDAGQESPDADMDGDDTAPEDEADTPIVPPASWKADAKKRFFDLPRDLQKVIADRESERETHLSRTQQETVKARKANEAERAAVQNERQAYVQGLSQLIERIQTADPIFAEGQRTDWASLFQQNPALAQAKWTQYQQRLHQMNAATAHRRDLQHRMVAEEVRRGHEHLGRELPFWNDPAQRAAFVEDLGKFLAGSGFAPQELASVTDARALIVARKAMLYDRLMTEQARIATARRAHAPGRVLRSQASVDHSESSVRVQKLKARAARTGRIDDAAAAVLASL